ncbi:M56 family metallopeptidase [Niabella insulamsoli]|uniref:M56 family metallopeptidase n=1 Tax=Niabella insulamsoli TaxID=3144874 RepID=UPI0031FE0229
MLNYLLQMIACSGILYGYYHIGLRNERFHQYNRFYLLAAMLLSLILPLIKIPVEVAEDNSPVYALVSTAAPVFVSSETAGWNTAVLYRALYSLVCVALLAGLAGAIARILRIRKQSTVVRLKHIQWINTSHRDAPFSFFNWLFWNRHTDPDSTEGRQILKHELYHIKSRHSWDLMFTEIVLALYWCNPFFYLYRKEIKTIHEFLADKNAVAGDDAMSYATLLVQQVISYRRQKLTHPFFHNQLKRRITMLTSPKKPAHQWLKKLIVLPIATMVLALFGFKYQQTIQDVATAVPQILAPVAPQQASPAVVADRSPRSGADTVPADHKKVVQEARQVSANYVTGTGRYQKLNTVTVVGYSDEELPKRKLKEGETKLDVEAAFPGNWTTFLERNVNPQIATEKGAPAGVYEVMVRFTINEDGSLSDFTPVTNEGYGMEAEVIRVLKKSEKWRPALNNKAGSATAVKSYRLQPVHFQVMRGKNTSQPKKETTATPAAAPADREPIFTRVEKDAHYPGNWRAFLEKNLDGAVAVKNGATAGNYTTIIQFIVDTHGRVSAIKPLTSHGFGMEEEAMRLIKASGTWSPAIQNGRKVKAYRKQPITFQIEEAFSGTARLNPSR